jgi:hypothetical protein
MQENNRILHVFDADRTLIDTDQVSRYLYASLEGSEYDIDALKEAERYAKQQGISFMPLRYLLMGRDEVERRKAHIIQKLLIEVRDPERVRLPGVTELLDMLRRDGADFMIHTFGDDDWQAAKLYASSLDPIPHIITQSAPKSLDVVQWRGKDGLFRVGLDGLQETYDEIYVYDDKESNFVGMPEGVITVHIVEAGDQRLTRIGPDQYRAVGAIGMQEFYRKFTSAV